MPDMTYSRAYETYTETPEQREALLKKGIHYSNTPVAGTLKRGAMIPFDIPKDEGADTTNYAASRAVKNPLTGLDEATMTEANRLYLVNCGICHGTKLDGNGPLWKGGQGPFPSAPKNLISDPYTVNMPPGQMYYSVTYGKNLMGAYGSQLDHHQRWLVISYIKSKQAANEPKPASTSNTEPANANAGSNATGTGANTGTGSTGTTK